MPPQLQELLQNKRMLAIIGGAVALVIVLVIVMAVMGGGGKKASGEARKLNPEERVLATVDNMGRAIEIQALLSREKVNILREDVEGGRAALKFDADATIDDRDRALITLVQSGLMDKNVGLEIFDKGDLTASREEKRIKLIRARNGELARLIRKIDPIQDASVFISMPEPTIFKRDMVPPTVTIQVSLNPGERLTRDKVRSIINLLVGSIENLHAKNVSLTDTNGTVYNSVLDAADELMSRLEERDQYMEQKIRAQLDRLIGPNKYVATVATYLRETQKTQLDLEYDPDQSSVSKTSAFQEALNARQQKAAGGPVSSYVPEEVESSVSAAPSQRGYNRQGQEIEYNSGKRQVSEDFTPGMLEEITVAVTVNGDAFPPNMTKEEFQTLVARAASPLVSPENVTIVSGAPEEPQPITPVVQSKFEVPWWVWAIAAVVVVVLFLMLLRAMSRPGVNPQQMEQQERQLMELRELAANQAQQLQNTQMQAQQLLQEQQKQLAQLTAQQNQVLSAGATNEGALMLKQTLTELQEVLRDDDDEGDEALGTEIRSWIEST